jgi:hypothetical protein
VTAVKTFVGWLLERQHRDDAIGRLAQYIAKDRAWRKASFADVFGRLVLTLPVEQLAGLQAAYRQYREAVEQS